MHIASCTLQSTWHTANCAQQTSHCTLHSTLHTAHNTHHTAYCTLQTAHCTLHTSHSTLQARTTHIEGGINSGDDSREADWRIHKFIKQLIISPEPTFVQRSPIDVSPVIHHYKPQIHGANGFCALQMVK